MMKQKCAVSSEQKKKRVGQSDAKNSVHCRKAVGEPTCSRDIDNPTLGNYF